MLQALVEGGAEGLVLIRDNASCEGLSLLRAFACAAARRQEPVQLLLLEAPREQFEAGLSPNITRWFQVLEGFPDPLGWEGGPPIDVGGLLEGSAPPKNASKLLLLDSLSWILLRLPPPQIGGVLRALLGGGHPKNGHPLRVVALLHEDLHPPSLLGALGGLADTQICLGGAPPPQKFGGGAPRDPPTPCPEHPQPPPKGGTLREGEERVEAFTLLPDGSLGPPKILGAPPAPPAEDFGVPPPPRPSLTFRLRLSPAERAARAAAPPPYLHRPSSLLQPPPPPEDEDPDDDLDV